MIHLLENSQIDKAKWDAKLRLDKNPKPYMFSWFLDIMTPRWGAYVKDDYDLMFPLTKKSKYGINYLALSPFVQQIASYGLSGTVPLDNEILNKLTTSFKFIDLCIGCKLENENIKLVERTNYTLDLSKPYEELYKGYRRRCRRNLKIATDLKPQISKGYDLNEIIELYKKNIGVKLPSLKSYKYSRIINLMDYCINNDLGEIYTVRKKGKLVYAAFFIRYSGMINLFFISTSNESHLARTGYYVTDYVIKKYAGKNYLFDFAGSDIPAIAYYNSSYGSKKESYFRLYVNKLPWPLKMFKKR